MQSFEKYIVDNFERFITVKEYALTLAVGVNAAAHGSNIVGEKSYGAKFLFKHYRYETHYFPFIREFLDEIQQIEDADHKNQYDLLIEGLKKLVDCMSWSSYDLDNWERSILFHDIAYSAYKQLKATELRIMSDLSGRMNKNNGRKSRYPSTQPRGSSREG